MALCELARLAGIRREWQQSAALFGEALVLHREAGHQLGMVECIEGLGGLVLEWGMAEQATRLIAAATAWRETTGATLPPPDREAVDRTAAAARAVLGAAGLRTLREASTSVSLDQAIDIALHIAGAARETSEGDALDQTAGG